MLFEFLKTDENWSLVRIMGDTGYFKKTGDAKNLNDWQDQRYNAAFPDYSFLPASERVKRNLASNVRRAKWAIKRRIPRRTVKP